MRDADRFCGNIVSGAVRGLHTTANGGCRHGIEQTVRSSIPEQLALHEPFELRRRDGRRIERGKKLLVLLSIQKESVLI